MIVPIPKPQIDSHDCGSHMAHARGNLLLIFPQGDHTHIPTSVIHTGLSTLPIAARCDHFRAMFGSGMRDASIDQLSVPGHFSRHAMLAMLHW